MRQSAFVVEAPPAQRLPHHQGRLPLKNRAAKARRDEGSARGRREEAHALFIKYDNQAARDAPLRRRRGEIPRARARAREVKNRLDRVISPRGKTGDVLFRKRKCDATTVAISRFPSPLVLLPPSLPPSGDCKCD